MRIKYKNLFLFSLGFFSLLPFSVQAQSPAHKVVAPHCLVKGLDATYKVLAKKANLLLLEVNENAIKQLIVKKNNHQTPCGGFMDVTTAWDKFNVKNTTLANRNQIFLRQYIPNNASAPAPEYKIQYQPQVEQLIKQINPQAMWTDLTKLSSFENRHARSNNGQEAANWIKSSIEELASKNHRTDVNVSFIETNGYLQPSVIAKVGNSSEPGIVIGGHLDTYAFSKRQPGADDDGSGSVTVLETARTVLASGMEFKKPIYFIWYAAEEEGLIGSQQVVATFKKKQIPVDAVLHFDMTGYTNKNYPNTMWLVQDNVSLKLTSYLETLINTYVKRPVNTMRCGYACSDHASWTQQGYAAATPFETAYEDYNPNIHSSRDTMDNLSLEHMTDFAKLAVAFTVELAEPTK